MLFAFLFGVLVLFGGFKQGRLSPFSSLTLFIFHRLSSFSPFLFSLPFLRYLPFRFWPFSQAPLGYSWSVKCAELNSPGNVTLRRLCAIVINIGRTNESCSIIFLDMDMKRYMVDMVEKVMQETVIQ